MTVFDKIQKTSRSCLKELRAHLIIFFFFLHYFIYIKSLTNLTNSILTDFIQMIETRDFTLN